MDESSRKMRARRRVLGRELQRLYEAVTFDAVPDEFMDFLNRIDESRSIEG